MHNMAIITMPSECAEKAKINPKRVDIGQIIEALEEIECCEGGKCILDACKEADITVQEFEKPEYCPLRKLGRRSDNHDGE